MTARIVVSVVRELGDLAVATTWTVSEPQAEVIERLMTDAGCPAAHAMVPMAALRRLGDDPSVIATEPEEGTDG